MCVPYILFLFFFFFLFQLHLEEKFPGQGLNLSCSCDLHHSFSNAGSLTHCVTVGTAKHWVFFVFFQGCTLSMWRFPGVQLELQLLAYATATATPDPSPVYNLHHSSWQRWILNPPIEARDQTRNRMVPIQIRFHCATTGTPITYL